MKSANNDSRPIPKAKGELKRLQEQIELARAERARLRCLVGAEETRWDSTLLLLEANEQMVASTLRAHLHVETAASQLDEVSRLAQLDGAAAVVAGDIGHPRGRIAMHPGHRVRQRVISVNPWQSATPSL